MNTRAIVITVACSISLVGVLGTGAYVNYLDTTTPPSDYYGANLPRLNRTAEHYDPSGIFGRLGG